jgi:hypothetical protein
MARLISVEPPQKVISLHFPTGNLGSEAYPTEDALADFVRPL